MNPRITKEIRTLSPAFVLAALGPLMVGPLLGFWSTDSVIATSMMLSALSCLAMGAMVFGDEFNHRTMTLLLSQPLPRARVWREKMVVFGVALSICFIASLLWVLIFLGDDLADKLKNDREDFIAAFCVIVAFALGIFCTVPFWTLKVKSMVGAIVFAVVTPAALGSVLAILIDCFPGLKLSVRWGQELYLVVSVMALYFGLCYWLGRRAFLRLQAVDTQWQEMKLPDNVERLFAQPLKLLLPGYSSPGKSLLNKELHLQKTGFVLAALYSVLFLVESVAWKLSASDTATNITVGLLVATFAIYVILIPIIVGGGCIAEERNSGTLGWQLTMPSSSLKQWLIKISVALGSSFVLGIILPTMVFELCTWMFHFPISPFTSPDSPLGRGPDKLGLLNCTFLYLVPVCMAILASSLSSSTLRAAVLSLVLTMLTIALFPLLGYAAERFEKFLFGMPLSGRGVRWEHVNLSIGVCVTMILGLILFLSFQNYKKIDVTSGRRWTQLAVLFVSISLCISALLLAVDIFGH